MFCLGVSFPVAPLIDDIVHLSFFNDPFKSAALAFSCFLYNLALSNAPWLLVECYKMVVLSLS
jgi:hypothetical protein